MLSIAAQPAAVEERRRHDHHREVDHAGERHRDHHVDLLEAEDAPPLAVVSPHDPALGERRMQVDDVRHHGGADDPGRQQDALGAGEPGHEQVPARPGRRRGASRRSRTRTRRARPPPAPRSRPPAAGTPSAGGRGSRTRPRRRSAPPANSGMPKSRLSPSAAPTTSATSVDIATISACTHSPIEAGRRKFSRQSSGRFLPVAMPSFADWVWTTIAIRLAARTTQSSRYPNLRAAGDVGGEVAGVDVGDGGDERRAEERPDPRRAAARGPSSERRAALRDRGLAGKHVLDAWRRAVRSAAGPASLDGRVDRAVHRLPPAPPASSPPARRRGHARARRPRRRRARRRAARRSPGAATPGRIPRSAR